MDLAQPVTSGPVLLALGLSLVAGLVSFASPCVVPLVPGYLAYLAGLVGATAPAVTVEEGAAQDAERRAPVAGPPPADRAPSADRATPSARATAPAGTATATATPPSPA